MTDAVAGPAGAGSGRVVTGAVAGPAGAGSGRVVATGAGSGRVVATGADAGAGGADAGTGRADAGTGRADARAGRADAGTGRVDARAGRVDARAGGADAGTGGAAARVDAVDWERVAAELDAVGGASLGPVLTPDECTAVRDLYDEPDRFRSTIDMARYRFGEGQYRYFDYPLPPLVAELRQACYRRLLPIARDWATRLGREAPWPDTLDEWLEVCHRAGQPRPTPILLRYTAGGWNALHRDLYGELVFPLQVAICLDQPGPPEDGGDHTGGEFLLVEQRPRAQSRGTVRALHRGEALAFTTRDRPVRSARGWSAAPVRHGVSTLLSGTRHTLGLVLHDAS